MDWRTGEVGNMGVEGSLATHKSGLLSEFFE
jgi:hypothetical protein